jgi:hypothetical protein
MGDRKHHHPLTRESFATTLPDFPFLTSVFSKFAINIRDRLLKTFSKKLNHKRFGDTLKCH